MKMSWISAALAAVAFTAFAPGAFASSHAEAPGTASDPDTDNTDVWAWRQGTNLVIVAGYNGLQFPYSAPNWKKFADDALYEIHIAGRGGADLNDNITYQIRFTTTPYPRVDPGDLDLAPGGGKEFFAQLSGGGAFNQTYSVTKIVAGEDPVTLVTGAKVAPPNVGPRTNAIAYGIPAGTTYEQFFVSNAATSVVTSLGTGEGRVFAGPRDDPFYVDLGAVFDLAGLRAVIGGTPRDSVAYTNVNTIALEIPIDVANDGPIANDGTPSTAQTVGIWASASRRKVNILRKDGTNDSHGPWRQVSRLGLPLVNEAVIGLQDKDYWNRLTPADDVAVFGAYFLNPVVVRDAEFAGFYASSPPGPLLACLTNYAGGDIDVFKTGRLDIVDTINIKDFPSAGAHDIPLSATGDVLRVDLGLQGTDFPIGRRLPLSGQEADVTDAILTLALCGLEGLADGAVVPDGVGSAGDVATKNQFPYSNKPHESFENGNLRGPTP